VHGRNEMVPEMTPGENTSFCPNTQTKSDRGENWAAASVDSMRPDGFTCGPAARIGRRVVVSSDLMRRSCKSFAIRRWP
jgi:hypothetical protein